MLLMKAMMPQPQYHQWRMMPAAETGVSRGTPRGKEHQQQRVRTISSNAVPRAMAAATIRLLVGERQPKQSQILSAPILTTTKMA